MESDYQGENHEYPVDTLLFWLYENRSQNGTVYLTGRMGLARVSVIKTTKKSDDGKPLWAVKVRPKRDADEEQAGAGKSGAGTEKVRPNAYAKAKAREESQAPLSEPAPPAATPQVTRPDF